MTLQDFTHDFGTRILQMTVDYRFAKILRDITTNGPDFDLRETYNKLREVAEAANEELPITFSEFVIIGQWYRTFVAGTKSFMMSVPVFTDDAKESMEVVSTLALETIFKDSELMDEFTQSFLIAVGSYVAEILEALAGSGGKVH